MPKTESQLTVIAERLFDGWNRQDVEAVVACYTEDLVYLDPNTRGAVQGADAMRRYLGKLFGRWEMHWSLRELFPLADADGAAALWHASVRKLSRPTGWTSCSWTATVSSGTRSTSTVRCWLH
jgi:ketosteroid isomerase-like protein